MKNWSSRGSTAVPPRIGKDRPGLHRKRQTFLTAEKTWRAQQDLNLLDKEPKDLPPQAVTETPSLSCVEKSDFQGGETPEIDADLARVIDAWPRLSEAVRTAMIALTGTADKDKDAGKG